MDAVCQICKDGGRDDYMLLCEACDVGYHYDCLTPPLKGAAFSALDLFIPTGVFALSVFAKRRPLFGTRHPRRGLVLQGLP